MNKLLFFVAAFVAVSLPAYAKLYWLPDYQFFNMKEGGRKYSPNSNRTATCSDGGYYNGVLGNDYNCAGVIYAHRVCYACTPKPCPNGYSTSVHSPCTPKEGYTEKFLSSGTSGGKVCGQCTYSEKSCAEGYSTDYQLAADCGSGSWSLLTNGKSGEKICGKCEPKNCPAGYDYKITSCTGDGYKLTTSGYHGAEKCGKCDLKDCPAGYDYTITTCGDGYNLVTNGYHGTQTCGKCDLKDCPAGYDYTITTCNKGYRLAAYGYHGTQICGKCLFYICDDVAIRSTSLFDGRANTKAMIDQIGDEALAATACNQFYAPGVDKNDVNFGQGQWYLPAIGELMEMYGTNAAEVTDGISISGADGDIKTIINDALITLKDAEVNCTILTKDYYWASSEYSMSLSWRCSMHDGSRHSYDKSNLYNAYVRCFQYLENKFNPTDAASAPKVGDVMYSDLTYGSADDYNKFKTVVGIVNWVSENGKSAKVVNLKDLRFSSNSSTGNFYPDDPYNGSYSYTFHTASAKYHEDITGIENYDKDQLLAAFKEAVAECAEMR